MSRKAPPEDAAPRKADPRPARTRALLFTALIELIQEKRWDRITVQDILDRTGVGRSTFYAHFDNKFDLLTAEIPSLIVPIAAADGRPDLLPLFEHIEEMQPVMRPLMSQPLLGEITDTFHRRLVGAWDEHLAGLDVAEPRRRMAGEILAGSFMAVGRRWLTDGCRPGAAEMCAEYTRYATAVIDRAVAGD